jgi:hypothetical protein
MEITDAAWFYSSLAQVSASMFGIIGAVFATRISDHMREASRVHDDISRMIGLRRVDLANQAEAMIDTRRHPPTVTPAELDALASIAELFRGLMGRVDPDGLQAILDPVNVHLAGGPSPFMRNHLEYPAIWLTQIQRQILDFRLMAFPRSLWAMWFLLAWLTVFGIIWPMLVLPGLSGGALRSKEFIMALFSAGALGFVAFMLRELILLWKLGRAFRWT